jgi:hypothetical protein
MRRILPSISALLVLLGGTALAPAEEVIQDVKIPSEPAKLTEVERDALALAEKIDQLIEAQYKDKKVQPAPLSDDSEFLRRAYLDLNGRIPGLTFARDYYQMSSPRWKHKRLELLRQLLKDPRYVEHFTNVWRSILLPPPGNDIQQMQFQNIYGGFDTWMRLELGRANPRFDRLARAMISAPDGRTRGASMAFYQANEYRAENLAAATSRLFLGFKLECAQCHDHPFAKWSRKQFWEFAAFFSGVAPRTPYGRSTAREIKIPSTGKVVKARFPDGTEPVFEDGIDSRIALLEWMTSPKNPYFAKATVNRMWEYFLGTGLIDPVDEPSDDNPPSHPELLELMAKEFAAHQFDLRFLTLAITASKTYQRSSALTDPSQRDHRLFARAVVRGLSAEQVLQSMATAAKFGTRPENNPFLRAETNPRPGQFGPRVTLGGDFLGRFPYQAKKREAATSILQALFVMNSKVTAEIVDTKNNDNLNWLKKNKNSDVKTSKIVEQLYLMTLTRLPRADERDRFVAYIDKGGPSGDRFDAISDVFWALLNCSEFSTNH